MTLWRSLHRRNENHKRERQATGVRHLFLLVNHHHPPPPRIILASFQSSLSSPQQSTLPRAPPSVAPLRQRSPCRELSLKQRPGAWHGLEGKANVGKMRCNVRVSHVPSSKKGHTSLHQMKTVHVWIIWVCRRWYSSKSSWMPVAPDKRCSHTRAKRT